jgi:uncharacterized protein YciI
VIFCHVAITTVDDYPTRRAPFRQAHLDRLMALRGGGIVIGGGPAPDGTTADVFYRAPGEREAAALVDDDPYTKGGVWRRYALTAFSHFLEPWQLPPLVTDGSRRGTIIEGATQDVDMASFALIEARGAGRMAFGGFFPDGRSLALMRSADGDEAIGWLADTGLWTAGTLTARPLLYVL